MGMDIREKLDYLKDLGVDVLWLNPIYQSPNVDNGYDISDYRDIMTDFGTMADFDALLADVQLFTDAVQVADTVTVGVLEAAWVDLVDDGLFPPRGVNAFHKYTFYKIVPGRVPGCGGRCRRAGGRPRGRHGLCHRRHGPDAV